jgi:hypothetical protein
MLTYILFNLKSHRQLIMRYKSESIVMRCKYLGTNGIFCFDKNVNICERIKFFAFAKIENWKKTKQN